MKFRLSKLK